MYSRSLALWTCRIVLLPPFIPSMTIGSMRTPLPAVSIDFGTAITFEVLEEDGNFTGGAILPGRQLMRHALHDHTALLPLVPLTESLDALPQKAGKNTVK